MNIQIGLHGGGRFRITDDGVDVSDVTPAVIAYGLSYVTRFGGQAGPYSVAEHSCLMYNWAVDDGQDKALLRAILLHDAPECLGEGDHQRFVKRAFFGDGPKKYAELVSTALWLKFAQPDRDPTLWKWSMLHDSVKHYDEYMGSLEANAFGFPHDPIPETVDPWWGPEHDVEPWSACAAREAWLRAWEKTK